MSTWELLVIALGLSMDAFAVSIGKGLAVGKAAPRQAAIVGLYFGGFQAGMPLLGYVLGSRFGGLITSYDHWIAFVLLALIGGKMILESRSHDEELGASFDAKTMLPLAVATSIDALAVGVSFAFLKVQVLPAVSFIGVTTLVVSIAGLTLGCRLGARNKSRAEVFGGLILIGMGVKILLEHLTGPS